MSKPVLILGGGPAGLAAAHSLATVGKESVIVEKEDRLGGAPILSGYAKLVPTGEWNGYEIKLIGSKIEVRLNGELVSKSDKMNGLTRGYIGLQGENGAHEYRNFRIKDLSK